MHPCFCIEAEPKFRILSICDRWSSIAGGVATFNRTFCKELKQIEDVDQVACMLTCDELPTHEEITDAEQSGVVLFHRSEKYALLSEMKPNFVIGHQGVPLVGLHMEYLDDLFKAWEVKYEIAHILHVYPYRLEHEKQPDGASARADKKEKEQMDLAERADVVGAVGPRLGKLWSARFGSNCPVVTLNPGLGEALKKNEARCSQLPTEIRILFMSRLDSDKARDSKGLHVTVAAMKHIDKELFSFLSGDGRGVTLVVRGFKNTEAADQFKDAAEKQFEHKLVQVEAKVFDADSKTVRREMQGAAVFLMPSKEEGFGLVALEALSLGIPVICTQESGFADALKHIWDKAFTGGDKEAGEFIKSWIFSPKGDLEACGSQLFSKLSNMLNTTTSRQKSFRDAEVLQRKWQETYRCGAAARALLHWRVAAIN